MTNPYAPPTSTPNPTQASATTVTTATKDALSGTKRWVKLVGILLFIGAGFTVIAAVFMVIAMGVAGGGKGGAMPFAAIAGMCMMYLVLAAIYGFLGLYLVRYSAAIGRLMIDGAVESLEAALQSQQKFWRLAGILALVMLGITLLGIVAAIAIPMLMRH
jgi:hypothetical protein